jgi:RNA polymerase sigma factor (sigma-70 family)
VLKMQGDSLTKRRRWDALSMRKGEFPAKTNPNRSPGDVAGSISPTNAPSEFPARANPQYGRAPLTDDQKALATRHLSLARAIARQLHARWRLERDEVESIAFVALVEAARCYDPVGGAKFSTLARYRIVGSVLEFAKKSWRNRQVPVSTVQGRRDIQADIEFYGKPIGVTPDLPVGAEIEAADTVESHLRPMPATQARACRLIYLEGKSQDEVAEIMECSPAYVSKIHREAMEFLFDRFGGRIDLHQFTRATLESEPFRPGQDVWCRTAPLRGHTRMPKSRQLATAC